MPLPEADSEPVKFAILELVNNSLRAHREKQVSEDILLEYKISSNQLIISVKDYGGGFDTRTLPYNLDEQPELIDVNSDLFQEYRERNHYQKFGMGLLAGKKVFPHFKIAFYNDQGLLDSWAPETTRGTIVTMGMDYSDE